MSEIWHRYDEAPKHQDIIMTDTGCWAYRADLLALETKLNRTRKALDVAKERLKNIILDVEVLATPEYLASRAKETLAEITALEQKE